MKKGLVLVAAYSLLLLVFDLQTALAMERFEIVTTQELVELLEQRKQGRIDFVLVNTLDRMIFRNQSIPESINIPWSEAVDMAPKLLGPDLEKRIITYCMGYR